MLSILHTSVKQIIKLFPVTGGMLNTDHILFSEALFRFAPAVMKADLIDMCFHASESRPPNKSTLILKNPLSYFSTKTYVVDTQTNRLIETVLLSTQNTSSNGRLR